MKISYFRFNISQTLIYLFLGTMIKMIIEKVKIEGFRNFSNLTANLKKSTLIIGANDIGKTNLMYALRLLLDKSLSERDIEPEVTDFHISKDGNRAEIFSITIMFKILILQAWYALSDEALEKQIARDLMFRRFIDLSLSEAVPDHSTIDGCCFIRLVVFWLSYAKVSFF
jgi:hypothetical protein